MMFGNSSKVAEWVKRIDDWRNSGLSLSKFCERNGIKHATMNRWLYKPECKRAVEEARRGQGIASKKSVSTTTQSAPITSPAFVPVRLREIVANGTKITESMQRSAIEILVGERRRIVVPRGFDAETLRQVIAVLESGPC
jgi:hypothetical protein